MAKKFLNAEWPFPAPKPPEAAMKLEEPSDKEWGKAYVEGFLDGKKEGFKEGIAWATGKGTS